MNDESVFETEKEPQVREGYKMIAFLNGQERRVRTLIFNKNFEALVSAALALPHGTDAEEASRNHNLICIGNLVESYHLSYKAVARTKRIYAADTNIHQLSKGLRHVALTGCTSLDLRNAQLALAAHYWDIPALSAFLRELERTRQSFWSVLLDHTGLGMEAKPLIKRSVYALIFGQSRQNLVHHFLTEVGLERKAALRAKESFFQHQVIQASYTAREQKIARTLSEGGLHDAYGEWIPASSRQATRSAMAQQLQSYEFLLMSAILPVLSGEKTITVCSWLHDGVTVHFGDRQEAGRQTHRLVQAMERVAASQGIITSLDVEKLA